jgi:AAA ATPase domain
MKLEEIEIFEFKSIIKEKISIYGNQLCLVGKNESGKSSIIQAISYLDIFGEDFKDNLLNKKSNNYPDGMPMIAGVFRLTEAEYLTLYKMFLEPMRDSISLEIPPELNHAFMQVKRWGNGFSNISIDITDKIKYAFSLSEIVKDKVSLYTFLQENIYPKIEYFEREEVLIEPTTVKELLGTSKRFETFRRLLRIGGCDDLARLKTDNAGFLSTFISKIESKLNRILEVHYKQDVSIRIKLQTIPGDKLCLVIQDSTEESFNLDERSPGFQYYFSFLVNKLYSMLINKDRNIIFLLDEPGSNLHPQGAKDLLKSFDKISEDSQIIFTTHNPFLAIRNSIDSLVFVDKNPAEGTKAKKKIYLNKYQILRKELGIMLDDSFLIGDINLVVEGITEKSAFHRLFSFPEYQELEWVNIYNADGVSLIPQAINYLGGNNLKLSGIVILDSDQEAENIKKTKYYKQNINRENWAEIEVNSAFDDRKERTFEDLFPQDLYIQAFNEYCHSLSGLGIFDKEYQDFPVDTKINEPIIDKISAYYKSFFPPDKKGTISKQDVIRILLDNIEKSDKATQAIALEKAFKLVDKITDAYRRIKQHAGY